ncbi:acyl-CoA hydrolase [Alkalihalobacillus alcalophilus ATCC 27647 = CGMCC 1.3604]|uniref:Acyl-CoA hydrolase n=1 Tax=Alkalihalobacillus alcalophilus ATCC 27647 = CGMCC 1.3604 TaxID=1218173 RepID=A0A094YUV3_ALKAL|nr:acyl-CoA thioesterase [Alkalihalobacillus alcalophilus]KGA97277.1 acyl-CoA hydrolase [Alkalihalobacillus alcalophilus ATCC 27647 = CGMCC 1.3604]MED1562800.1 acyl-CoA thioesterase [Alkalihalobacillus alcalophilus]THG91516.1 acyl-CoA hydrolase [Alkalihalobacillus alcalophilus ATCC 27647 = CGMCC 1.3604]
MNSKVASESKTVLTDLVLPPDTNFHGTMFGGNVMANADKVASIAAMRHARATVVTASSDSMDFIAPIHTGEAICIEAYVTYARRTSMEVYVKVEAENLITGEKRLTATAYMTFVALDNMGKPTAVPKLIPETEEEKWQYEGAEQRFSIRKRRTDERKKRQAQKEKQ